MTSEPLFIEALEVERDVDTAGAARGIHFRLTIDTSAGKSDPFTCKRIEIHAGCRERDEAYPERGSAGRVALFPRADRTGRVGVCAGGAAARGVNT
jgi:hypothetical protein